VRAEDRADSERVVADVAPGRLRAVVTGGATRHESESAALRALEALPDVGWVMLHDAARPFVTLDLLERLVDRARDGRVGVVPGLPVRDAMVDQRGAIVDIAHLVTVQTPQLFARADVVEAYRRAGEDDFHGVDTAETVARYTATPVEFVASDPRNLKITTVDDLTTARALVDRWRDGAWEDRP
jgi:2-C-methyl-D-erythritol 4-phosphate cytidylyltransferase